MPKKKQSYIGKTGYVTFEGLRLRVKVLDERNLAGREMVLVKPVGSPNSGTQWKYLRNIELDEAML